MDLTCLNDGASLDMVSQPPHTPPWRCSVCNHGWWNAELTDAARAAWRFEFQDFGDQTVTILAAVALEQAGS